MIEQPEEGIGVYYQGKEFNVNWEGYVILKNKLKTKETHISSQIKTFGARFRVPVSRNILLYAEGAFQNGEQGDNAISAWGGYTHLDYSIREIIPCLEKFTLGAIALSGDDPGTSTMEGWDPLFSRWPKWSESYIYTLIPETGGKVAYWSNLSSLNGSLVFKFTDKLGLKLTYHYLKSFHDFAFISSRKYGRGNFRGDLVIARSTFQINKYFKGHVVFETFNPGDFYSSEDDPYNWFRFELMYSF
ncbi:MAG: alginate export family protein [bacterium]